jgi:hypothetical protein
MRRPVFALAIVVAVLAVTVGIAEGVKSSATTPAPATVAPSAEPVVGARLVCPDVVTRTVGRIGRIGRVGIGLPSAAPAGVGASGSVTMTPLAQLRATNPKPAVALTRRGTGRFLAPSGVVGDLVVDATGSLAPGLAADVFDRRDGGSFRGIDGVACTAPGGEAWLLGASTVVGAHSELRLTNTDDLPALVDVLLSGTKGPVTASAALGIAVPPRTTKSIPLESLAPEERMLLTHVVTRSGRVAVSMRVQSQRAATPQGVDWLPLAGPPVTQAVVPGVIQGTGPRQLVIANPGDNDATASVEVLLRSSAFVPRGMSAITVPAGSVVVVDLTKALLGRSAGVAVTSDRPVVAGALMSTGPRVIGIAETAWSAGVPALTDPATAVVNYVRARVSLLMLTAPGNAADVEVRTLAGVGPAPTRTATIHVPSGRTVQVDLATYAGRSPAVGISVSVAPGSGPVYAARATIESGSRSPLYTVLPLRSAPQVRLVRPAVADLLTGIPADRDAG